MDRDDTSIRTPSQAVGSRTDSLDAAMAEVWVRMTVILARTQMLRRGMQSGQAGETSADILASIEPHIWALETALRASESRFRVIVEEADDYAILTTDMEGRIDGWYPGAAAVFGWTVAEALGQSVAMLFTPEDQASGMWLREFDLARESGYALDARWHVRKDGTPVYINGSAYAITGPGGEFQGLFKIGQDVTARRAAVAELRESEARLRTLIQNLPDYAIFMLDPNGVITGWTEGAERVTGYASDDVIGQPVTMFYIGEDIEDGLVQDELREAAETGRAERECWQVRKDGTRYWVNEIATAVRDEGGELVAFTKISRDLTERMRAEEALREREERYRLIVEEARDYAIFTTDVESRIETWTPGAAAVFGWSAEEAIGQIVDVTFTAEDRAAGVPEQEYVSARDNGSAPDVRWHQCKDGRRVFIEGTSYAIRGPDGEFRGLFKIGQDVTKRMRDEASLRESEEWLQQRVAEATAELRAISRRLIEVQEEERRHLARELHDEIGQGLTALGLQLGREALTGASLGDARRTVHELTDQIRQLSMDLRPAALDAFGLLPAVRWHIERYQTRTGILVDLRQEGVDRRFAAPVEITAYRILQEALTNVARHSGERAAVVHMLAENQTLTIVVRDDGRGFDTASVSSAGGLGGMRERVELLGGTLTVDTAPDAGTLVTAELPIDHAGIGPSPEARTEP